jgi:hypothetical protein
VQSTLCREKDSLNLIFTGTSETKIAKAYMIFKKTKGYQMIKLYFFNLNKENYTIDNKRNEIKG